MDFGLISKKFYLGNFLKFPFSIICFSYLPLTYLIAKIYFKTKKSFKLK